MINHTEIIDKLIVKNGFTTTLDVKMYIRSLGEKCTQNDIKLIFEFLYTSTGKYSRELINNTYYKYTFSNIINKTIPGLFDNDEIKNHTNKNDWIVYDKDYKNYIIFNETLTRDNVRCKFASTYKIKIQQVRARKIKNI